MPFTPVHLGPAALFKGLFGHHFSFVVFGGAQVLIDLEPLIQIIRGAAIVHGPSHTLLGATVIGLVAFGLGKPIGQLFLKLIRHEDTTITWKASALGAFIGTYSHVLIDGVMHSDMSPWSPVNQTNHLLGLVAVSELHYFCMGAGVLGLAIIGLRRYVANTAR